MFAELDQPVARIGDRSQRDPEPPRLHGLWGGLLGDDGHTDARYQDADQQGGGGAALARRRDGAAGDSPDSGNAPAHDDRVGIPVWWDETHIDALRVVPDLHPTDVGRG